MVVVVSWENALEESRGCFVSAYFENHTRPTSRKKTAQSGPVMLRIGSPIVVWQEGAVSGTWKHERKAGQRLGQISRAFYPPRNVITAFNGHRREAGEEFLFCHPPPDALPQLMLNPHGCFAMMRLPEVRGFVISHIEKVV